MIKRKERLPAGMRPDVIRLTSETVVFFRSVFYISSARKDLGVGWANPRTLTGADEMNGWQPEV